MQRVQRQIRRNVEDVNPGIATPSGQATAVWAESKRQGTRGRELPGTLPCPGRCLPKVNRAIVSRGRDDIATA